MSITENLEGLKNIDITVVKMSQKKITEEMNVNNAQILIENFLSSDDYNQKQNILEIFVQNPSAEYGNILIKAFQSEKNEDLKFLLSIALGKCGNTKIVNHMISLFERNDFIMCHKVLYTLKTIGNSELLIAALPNAKEQSRYFIKETLKRIPNVDPSKLYNFITLENTDLSKSIFEILGSVRTKENVLKLIEYLKSSTYEFAGYAASALYGIGDSIADFLGGELKKDPENKNLSEFVPGILKKFGDKGQSVLKDILNDTNINNNLLLNVLKNIEYSEDIVEKIINLSISANVPNKLEIGKTLCRFGEKASAHFYKKLFESDDKNIKSTVMYGFFKNEKINSNVINEIHELEKDAPLKKIFKYVLSEARPGNTFNIYVDMLKSIDFFDREVAEDIIENLDIKHYPTIMEGMGTSSSGPGEIILNIFKRNLPKIKGLIFTLIKEGTDSQKISAAFILGELKLEDSIEALVNATKDGNEWVRNYAFKSLVNIKGQEEAERLAPGISV